MSDPLPVWARPSADGRSLLLTLHVQPNAKLSAFAGRHGDALKVRVAAPAVDDRANQALLEFLRRSLGTSRSALAIVHGHAARRKIVAVAGSFQQWANHIRRWDDHTT